MTRKNFEISYTGPWKPHLNEKRTLKDLFYLKIVSYRGISDITQTLLRRTAFSSSTHFAVL